LIVREKRDAKSWQRLVTEPQIAKRILIKVATDDLNVMNAELLFEKINYCRNHFSGGDCLRIENGSHTHRLPSLERRSEEAKWSNVGQEPG